MNLTEKYQIQMKYNQFAQGVSPNFQDADEQLALDHFEKTVLQLMDKKKDKFSMIELGSNYAYYSMLFKKILGPDKTFNLLLEPYETHMNIGKEHFELNELEGIFLEERIYNPEKWCGIEFSCPSITIDTLLERYEIDDLDVLHCDIDQSETYMLDGSVKSLTDKKIDNLFIMTHAKDSNEATQSSKKATELHEEVRSRLLDFGYTLVFDHETCDQAGDGMVIFKR